MELATQAKEAEKENQASAETGYLLWKACNLWQRHMRATLEPLGLTHVQFFLIRSLWELSQTNTVVSQNTLAAHAGTDKMMASKVLRLLEERMLITRTARTDDHRSMNLSLTHQGQALLDRARPAVILAEKELFSPLGKKQEKLHKHLHNLMKGNT